MVGVYLKGNKGQSAGFLAGPNTLCRLRSVGGFRGSSINFSRWRNLGLLSVFVVCVLSLRQMVTTLESGSVVCILSLPPILQRQK